MSRLAILIVSWNVAELLQQSIASIQRSMAESGISYQILVVDNASRDATVAILQGQHPEVQLIESGANLGFAGGNNLGLRYLLAQPDAPECLLLLNPDTEIVGTAIPALVAFLDRHQDVAVVGPLLRYADGSIQSSRRRFPKPGVFFFESTPLEWRWPGNPWAKQYRMADQSDDQQQDVDWLVGAALLVRRSAIEAAGLLDAGFALYSEEMEWQRRLKRYGRIVFLPEAEIIHYEGRSSEQVPERRLILFQQSRLRYIGMVYGPGLATIVRRFLQIAYRIEWLTEGFKWLLGHRRDLREQRLKTYVRVLEGLKEQRTENREQKPTR